MFDVVRVRPMLITKPRKYGESIIKWAKYSDNMYEKKFVKFYQNFIILGLKKIGLLSQIVAYLYTLFSFDFHCHETGLIQV